jgi:beta-phosphoglucomutase-like phosphatase (HAD superfamily)
VSGGLEESEDPRYGFRAVVFDFDGLIIDSETPDYLAWNAIYARRGFELPLDLWCGAIGSGPGHDCFDPVKHLSDLVGRPLDVADLRNERRPHFLQMVDAQPLLPGVEACFNDAQQLDLKIGVASSSPLQWVGPRLEKLGLARSLGCLRTREDVDRVKPDPALYRCAVEALGVRPEEAVAFEDSQNGVIAAKEAGLRCVAVPNEMTRRLCFDRADLVLDTLSALPLREVLGRLR